eukprot:symbB.v1.2.026149.t1/scaffold2590.1/size75437/1
MLPNPSPRKVTFEFAESPRILGQLERLRQQLSAVRSEAKILKKKLSDNELATAECARLWKANRRRVCELIEEEQEEDAEDDTSDFHTKVRVEKEVLELRDEIIHLANEVKCLADLQLWRAGKLRQLKMLAKVQKAQQGVKLAQAEEKELQKLKEQQVNELQTAKDQCDVLRKRKTKLKDELISVRADLAGPSRPSPSELLVVLRSQLRAEELPFVPGTPSLVSSPMALPTRQKRPSLRRASASDRLLYDSLSREVGKLKSGKVRAADRLFRREKNAQTGARRSRPTVPVQPSTRGPVHGTGAPVAARLFGLMCFLGPLVLAIPYGMQLFASSSMLREFLLRPLLPLVLAFHSSKFANLLSIVGLYALARNRSLHPFTRSIGEKIKDALQRESPVILSINLKDKTFDVTASGTDTIGQLRRLIALTYFQLGFGKISKQQILKMMIIHDDMELHTRPRATLHKLKLPVGCQLQAILPFDESTENNDNVDEEDDDDESDDSEAMDLDDGEYYHKVFEDIRAITDYRRGVR